MPEPAADRYAAPVGAVMAPPGASEGVGRPGDAPEATPSGNETVITVSHDGPLLVRGRIRIENAAGETIATADAASLCRCGATANPPYCDGSHLRRCPESSAADTA